MLLSHVAILTANLEKLAEFYRKLGLKDAFQLNGKDGQLWILYLDAGPRCFVELIVKSGAKPAGAAPAAGLHHVCLEVADLAAEVTRLQGLGLAFTQPPNQGRDGNRQAWLADPDGNQVELMQLAPGGQQASYWRNQGG